MIGLGQKSCNENCSFFNFMFIVQCLVLNLDTFINAIVL